MNKDKTLLAIIGILVIAVLVVEAMPLPEPVIVPQSVREVTYTPAKKSIGSSAATSAFIMPGSTAQVTVTIK